jgi:hypothetical protein
MNVTSCKNLFNYLISTRIVMKVSRTIVAIGLMAMTVMLASYTVIQTVKANTIHSHNHPFTPSKNKTKKVFMAICVELSFSYFVAFTALSTLFIVFAFNTWATTT